MGTLYRTIITIIAGNLVFIQYVYCTHICYYYQNIFCFTSLVKMSFLNGLVLLIIILVLQQNLKTETA